MTDVQTFLRRVDYLWETRILVRFDFFCSKKKNETPILQFNLQFHVSLPQANGGHNPTKPPKVYKIKLTLVADINPE